MILQEQVDKTVAQTTNLLEHITTVLGHSMCSTVATRRVLDLILNQAIMLEQLSYRLKLLEEATNRNDKYGIQMILNSEIPLEHFVPTLT